MSEDHRMELLPCSEKIKKYKRKSPEVIEDGQIAIPVKMIKRIMLSLTKPSYVLGLGADNVRSDARDRLGCLLTKLIRQQNWVEASGVLSVFLKGTCKDKSPPTNRLKYSVAMELLRQIESDHVNPTRIKNIFDIWMKKVGSMKDQPVEDRFVVHLEFILFCLTEGNIEEARQAALSLMQENDFGNEPMSNLVTGLTFSQIWYSTIPREMQWKDPDPTYTYEQLNMSESRFSNESGKIESYNLPFYTHEGGSSFHCESDSSVMIGKSVPLDVDTATHNEDPMAVDAKVQREGPPKTFQPQVYYPDSAENTASEAQPLSTHGLSHCGSIFSAHGLDSWLLPIQLPHSSEDSDEFFYMPEETLNDYYKDAVKYLRLAVRSTPPISAALLPLVQLLLIGGQVNETRNEIESFCDKSKDAFSSRLKGDFFEWFDYDNHVKLSSSLEDALEKDPTCRHSLERLVKMHQNGNYGAESLLDMISWHLDATYADYIIWRELALCFLKITHSEEDRMSMHLNEKEDGQSQHFSMCYKTIPKIFSSGRTKKMWKLRCRWWMTRHFSHNILASEIRSGDFDLLTYKAACASQMYGEDFYYVGRTFALLLENRSDLASVLRTHMCNSIGLNLKYEGKN